MATDLQIRNRRLVLSYLQRLLDAYQVRGFGGAPPPAPVVYQLPASSLSASRMFADPVAHAIPGVSVFQLVQMLAPGSLEDGAAREHHFPPPNSSAPIFVTPAGAVFAPTETREPLTPANGERPDGWEEAVRLMRADTD
eukprot:jgi/Mesvir1/10946/Mv11487-RA.1